MCVSKRFDRSIAVMVLLGACLSLGTTGPAAAGPVVESPYPPTDRYEARRVEGWPVLVSKEFLQNEPELADRTLTLLRYQLYQVVAECPGQGGCAASEDPHLGRGA